MPILHVFTIFGKFLCGLSIIIMIGIFGFFTAEVRILPEKVGSTVFI